MSNHETIAWICQRNVITVSENASVKDAAELMRKHHVGSLIVTSGSPKRVLGIVTDRDIAIVAVARDFDPLTLLVEQIMTAQVHTIADDATPAQAMQMMRKFGVRRLPVTNEHGDLTGILSFDDLIDSYISQLHVLIQGMHRERDQEQRTRA